MIGGHVNAYREAVISLSVEGSSSLRRDIDAVIDTGFNGYLTLPAALVQALGLVWRRRGRAMLADGSDSVFDIYEAAVTWELRNLGPTLRRWRREWSERREHNPLTDFDLPGGGMHPIGYVVLQHAVRLNRPAIAYERWIDRIPRAYRESVVGDTEQPCPPMEEDPHCLAILRHVRSLMPLAQEARKPMFALKPADGAIGGHANAVRGCYRDFRALAREVARRCEITASGT